MNDYKKSVQLILDNIQQQHERQKQSYNTVATNKLIHIWANCHLFLGEGGDLFQMVEQLPNGDRARFGSDPFNIKAKPEFYRPGKKLKNGTFIYFEGFHNEVMANPKIPKDFMDHVLATEWTEDTVKEFLEDLAQVQESFDKTAKKRTQHVFPKNRRDP